MTAAALFPQNSGADPTGTVGALALPHRGAIRERYLRHPNALLV